MSIDSRVPFKGMYWDFPRYWDERGITTIVIALFLWFSQLLHKKMSKSKETGPLPGSGLAPTLIILMACIFTESILGLIITFALGGFTYYNHKLH